jgi:hypothetical protein
MTETCPALHEDRCACETCERLEREAGDRALARGDSLLAQVLYAAAERRHVEREGERRMLRRMMRVREP